MAYTTEQVTIPLNAEAQLNQIKQEVSKINTAVNEGLSRTSGVEKRNPQLASVNNSIRNVQDSLSKAIQQLHEFVNTPIVNPDYKELGDTVRSIIKENAQLEKSIAKITSQLDKQYEKQSKISELLKEAKSDMVMTADYSNVVNQLSKTQNSIENAQGRIKNLNMDINKNIQQIDMWEKYLGELKKSYEATVKAEGENGINARKTAADIKDYTTWIAQAKAENESLSKELEKVTNKINEQTKAVEELTKKRDDMRNSGQAYEYTDPEKVSTLEDAYDRVSDEIRDTNGQLAQQEIQLEDNLGVIEQCNEQMQEMSDNGEDVIDPTTTERYQELVKRIEALERRLAQLGVRQDQVVNGTREWGRLVQRVVVSALSLALSYLMKIRSTINQGIINIFKNIGKTIVNNILGALKQIPTVVSSIKSGMNQLAGIIANKVGQATLGLLSTFKNIFAVVGRGVITIGKSLGSRLTGMFSGFTSSIMSAFDATGTIESIAEDYTQEIVSARDEVQKKLDDYTAKNTKLDVAINPQVATNIDILKNKVNELDNQLKKTNTTMGTFGSRSAMATFQNLIYQINDLKASLQQLRNAWGAAFAPIVSLVIPYLQQFVSWLIRVVNTIAQFIAALTGHATYLRAIKPAIGGNTGGTKKNTKATKDNTKAKKDNNDEMNKQLSGLDKLNVLHADETKELEDQADALDDLDDLGGIGGGGLGSLFEEVPIDKKIFDWIDKLKEMWEKGDFSELGELLANKLADILEAIPWDIIKEYSAKIGKSLGTLIDGFFKVERLARAVGKTIGEVINTIQIFFTNLLENIDFSRVGRWFGTALMTAFETIDWAGIGHLFALGLNSLFSLIDGFLQKFNDNLVSDSISTMINTAFTDFNWSYTAVIIGRFFRKLFNTISKTIDKTHFEDLGKGLTAFLGNKNMWRSLFVGITDTLNSAFNALQRFMDKFDGVKIAKNIASSINDGFANFSWKENGKTIGNFFYGLIDTVLSFIEDIDFVQIINGISDALEGLRWQDIADRFIGFIDNLNLGDIAKTLSDRIKSIDFESVGKTFAEKWNTLFEKAKEWGKNFDGKSILTKIANAINTAVQNFNWKENGKTVGNFIRGLIDSITNFLQTVDKDELISGIATFIENMDWDSIVSSLDSLFDELDSWLDTIEENIDWDKVDTLMSHVIDRVVDFLAHAIDIVDLSKVKKTIWSAIKSKLKLNPWEILYKLLGGITLLNLATNFGKTLGGRLGGGIARSLGQALMGSGGISTAVQGALSAASSSSVLMGAATILGGTIAGGIIGAIGSAIAFKGADVVAHSFGYEGGWKEVKEVVQKEVDDISEQIKEGTIPDTKEMEKVAHLNNYGNSAGAAKQMQAYREEIINTNSDLKALTKALEENGVKVRGNGLNWADNTKALQQISEGLRILETNGNDVDGMLTQLKDKYGKLENSTNIFFNELNDGIDVYENVQSAMHDYMTATSDTADVMTESNNKILHSSQTVEDWYASQGRSQEYYDSLVNTVDNATEKIVEKSDRLGIELDKVPTSVKHAIEEADREVQLKSQSLEQNLDRLPTSVKSAIERANQESQLATQSLANNMDRLPTSVKSAIENASHEADISSQVLKQNLDRLPTSVQEAIKSTDSAFSTTNMPNLQSFGTNVQTALDTSISTETMTAKATETVSALDSSFTVANMPNVQTFGTDVKTAVETGLPTQAEMTTVGDNITAGLKNGIVTGLSTMPGAMMPGLTGIIMAVTSIFKINSPSLVMQDIGKNIVQGLVNGWSQNIGTFATQVTTFGNQLVTAFGTIRTRVVSTVTNMVSNVRSALSSLASMISNVASQVSNAMSNIGNQVSNMANNAYNRVRTNITIPRHATGQVIPPSMSEYLAILGDNNKETEVVSPLSTMKQAMIEAMSEMSMYGIGGGNSGDIVIQIDGREVFRAVQTQNNQFRKQTGMSAFA